MLDDNYSRKHIWELTKRWGDVVVVNGGKKLTLSKMVRIDEGLKSAEANLIQAANAFEALKQDINIRSAVMARVRAHNNEIAAAQEKLSSLREDASNASTAGADSKSQELDQER